MTLSLELLAKQNAETSNAIITHMADNADFVKLAKYEGTLTMTRDQEDDEKLQVGIDYAKSKGVIDPNFVPRPYQEIDVLGKTPAQVAQVILQSVQGVDSGVICLVGLSGTGKGTTVAQLRAQLEETNKTVVTWSNGNIFRSVTLLAATWCEQNNVTDIQQALTKENLESFMGMLEFGKFDGSSYDTRIQGLGLDLYVSQVQNTVLKSPKVSQNIPTVAQVTQGEVILFAAKAVQTMTQQESNLFVLLEGRAQTVNYVPTPHRFCLVLSDDTLIGKRRAAQRLMAEALKGANGDESQVETALIKALERMVAEIP